jgi:hypothetical protein
MYVSVVNKHTDKDGMNHLFMIFIVANKRIILKGTIFWDIMPCCPLKVNRLFGGTYRLHLQGRQISRAGNQLESSWHAGFLLGLFFDPEDGGDMFL